jgi:hypothetical protein
LQDSQFTMALAQRRRAQRRAGGKPGEPTQLGGADAVHQDGVTGQGPKVLACTPGHVWAAMSSQREARLVSVVARDSRAVLEHVVRGVGAPLRPPPLPQELVPPGVRVLPLVDAEPPAVYAVTRLEDRRPEVALAVACLADLVAGVRPQDDARR